VASLAAAALVAAPWLVHTFDAGGIVPLRAQQLSVFGLRGDGEPWATLARNVVGHLGMFHVRGGAYARDDLPGFPMLDPVTGALLLVGLVVVVRTADSRRRLLISWPLVLGLGGILSVSGEGPPYPYRVLALAPWACLLAGIGGDALWELGRRRWARGASVAIASAALTAVVAFNAWVLFVRGPADLDTMRVYGTAPTRLGLWLRDHADGRPTLVLDGALSPPPESGSRYAAANRTSFFRDVDTLAAIQLAAGAYRRDPTCALEPLRATGDVDRARTLPSTLERETVLVVSDVQAKEAEGRFAVERDVTLRYADGTPLARVLVAGRRP
jgi:hypothetical protein